jgi:hypothetical protein
MPRSADLRLDPPGRSEPASSHVVIEVVPAGGVRVPGFLSVPAIELAWLPGGGVSAVGLGVRWLGSPAPLPPGRPGMRSNSGSADGGSRPITEVAPRSGTPMSLYKRKQLRLQNLAQ